MDERKLPKEVLAWWLVPSDFKLANGDGRIAKVGHTQEVQGSIRACNNGLHASERLKDALKLCPSHCTQLFLVKLHGDMDGHNWMGDRFEKIAAQFRTYLAHITIDDAIREICLNVIRDGVAEHQRRITRYGKDAGYRPLPPSIIEFSKTGVMTESFLEVLKGVFASDPWKRLREGIKYLMEKNVTHKALAASVSLVASQFGLKKKDVWLSTEKLVMKMMTDRVTDRKLLPSGMMKLPAPVSEKVVEEQHRALDEAIAQFKVMPALPTLPAKRKPKPKKVAKKPAKSSKRKAATKVKVKPKKAVKKAATPKKRAVKKVVKAKVKAKAKPIKKASAKKATKSKRGKKPAPKK